MDDSVPAVRVSLRRLLPEAAIYHSDDIEVTSCASDSRGVQPGDLFVALVGHECDGHEFVDEAVFRGASALLVERYVAAPGVPVCVVPDSRAALGQICQALAGRPSERLKVIAVTGTSGKTSAVCLTTSVLEAGGRNVGWIDSFGAFDGEIATPAGEFSLQPASLAAWLARMAANGCTHAVIEVSSQDLARSLLSGVEVDVACVTNVRPKHLEVHNSSQSYREVKSRIFRHLRPGGAAVLNLDDPICAGYLEKMNGPALCVGLLSNADVTAGIVERTASEQTLLVSAGCDALPLRTRTVGDLHATCALIAAAVGLLEGIDAATAVRGIERIEWIAGRMERLDCGQPFHVFVDSADSADGLCGALETLREVVDGRLICVFGAKGSRDRGIRPLMGQAVEAIADLAIVTDDDPGEDEPSRIAADILRGFESLEQVVVMHDRAKAIGWALAHAEPGDCVLIAGKGHEASQLVGRQRYWFDDREVARQLLHDRAKSLGALTESFRRLRAG